MSPKEKLEKLEKERLVLLPISQVSFKSKDEGQKYIQKNYEKLNRLNEIEAEIRELKYNLKTPEEKKEYDEYLEKLKLKSQGKPLI